MTTTSTTTTTGETLELRCERAEADGAAQEPAPTLPRRRTRTARLLARLSGRRDARHAVALFDYAAEHPGELPLHVGDAVDVTDDSDFDWWVGTLADGRRGMFPAACCTTDLRAYLRDAVPPPSAPRRALATVRERLGSLARACCTGPCCVRCLKVPARIVLLLLLCSVCQPSTDDENTAHARFT